MNGSWSPAKIAIAFVVGWAASSAGASGVGLAFAPLTLNENQILYLFSTSAQVLAGIYGLTLTGFVFFRNELSREESEDDTLEDAVERLKARYFQLLLFITSLVFATLLLCNLVISSEESDPRSLTTVLLNTGQAAFVTSLLAIAYFIFDVVSPKRIEKISKTLQTKIDPGHALPAKGNLEDFLRNYNQIEALLAQYGSVYQPSRPSLNFDKRAARLSNARLAGVLARNERISPLLYEEVRSLITLRNSIIHGADPGVSIELVEKSTRILKQLNAELTGKDDEAVLLGDGDPL